MSEYEFGVEDETNEPAATQDQGPKWFREQMAKVSQDIKSLREENETLRAERARTQVREALTQQGYAPQVADLYTGKPEGLNDWLTAHGAVLAKADGAAVEQGQQAAQGAAQSAVSPEDQAAMERMAAAGQGAQAPALSADDQLTARLNAAKSMEELDAIMREAGSRYF